MRALERDEWAARFCLRYFNMSKVGKHPIFLPNGTSASFADGVLTINGGSSKCSISVPDGVLVDVSKESMIFSIKENTKKLRSLWGTVRSLANNALKGLVEPFTKRIDLVGVGYRASVSGSNVELQLAYSHNISVAIPDGVSVKVDKQTAIFVTSSDKQKLGAFLRKLQSFRPPEPYKGKGLIIEGQYVYRKEGKKK